MTLQTSNGVRPDKGGPRCHVVTPHHTPTSPIPTNIGAVTMVTQPSRLVLALSDDDPSMRLRAALAAGSQPDPALLEPLVERCGVEPDFHVRDTLSWALTMLPRELTLPRIGRELHADGLQARTQALHTLSKIADPATWTWIPRHTLHDADDELARTAWRAAVAVVPRDQRTELAADLSTEFGRGDRGLRWALTRALLALDDAALPVVESEQARLAASVEPDDPALLHARATRHLLVDPDLGFDEAERRASDPQLGGQ
ncbi:HEAT repeat domain-containing protein [Aestuariimicrobium soli]|uniref:HEAT repeat domain-containing protein n=1 Tax=Aestuariimicrobium soli TaxID=2035834 RepID=UPI003EBC1E99